MTAANLQAVARTGFVHTADQTAYRVHLGGAYAVNNVATLGVANSASGNIVLNYNLKTVKRYNAATLAVDLSVKVAGDASNKWL